MFRQQTVCQSRTLDGSEIRGDVRITLDRQNQSFRELIAKKEEREKCIFHFKRKNLIVGVYDLNRQMFSYWKFRVRENRCRPHVQLRNSGVRCSLTSYTQQHCCCAHRQINLSSLIRPKIYVIASTKTIEGTQLWPFSLFANRIVWGNKPTKEEEVEFKS